MGKDELQQLDNYINVMEGTSGYVVTQKKALLDSWFQKPSFDQRISKLGELKAYRAAMAAGNSSVSKPELATYLNSVSFRKAYQCYSCHKPSGL